MLAKFYLLLGIVILGLYTAATVRGWEFGNPARERVPENMRNATGYRSFWYTGYHGGK